MTYLISYIIEGTEQSDSGYRDYHDISSFFYESETKINGDDICTEDSKLKESVYAYAKSIDDIPEMDNCYICILSFSLF